MSKIHDVMPHGELRELFTDVHFVTGTVKPTFNGQQFQFSRNMTVVKDGDALTLINSVRLDDDGLAKLESLGTVKNVVKLGASHGMDNHFYKDKYGAIVWGLPGCEHEGGYASDKELADGRVPFAGCSIYKFACAEKGEGVMHIDRDGGILVSSDSVQNWAEVDRFFNEESAKMMTRFGFIKPVNIGPGWLQSLGEANPAPDFKNILALDFKHLLPGHGAPLKNEAKEKLSETIATLFKS